MVCKNVADLRALIKNLKEKQDLIPDLPENICFASNLSALEKYTDEMENKVNPDLALKETRQNELNADRKEKTAALEQKFAETLEKEEVIENTNVVEDTVEEVATLEDTPEVVEEPVESIENTYEPESLEEKFDEFVPEEPVVEESLEQAVEGPIIDEAPVKGEEKKVLVERSAEVPAEIKKAILETGFEVLDPSKTIENGYTGPEEIPEPVVEPVQNLDTQVVDFNNTPEPAVEEMPSEIPAPVDNIVDFNEYKDNKGFTDNLMNELDALLPTGTGR